MLLPVQKSPIRVIRMNDTEFASKNFNIDNFSELNYRKIEDSEIPNCLEKYMKWVGLILMEMTIAEKNSVDAAEQTKADAELSERKTNRKIELADEAIAWVMGQYPGKRLEGYIFDLYPAELRVEVKATVSVAFTKLYTSKYPSVDACISVAGVNSVVFGD